MGTLNIAVKTGLNAATLTRDYERSTGTKYATVQSIADLIQSVLSGNQVDGPAVAVSVLENEDSATGTFTLTSVIATDVCSINGVSFTCVSSGATGNQFNVGADDDETADNLVAAINGSVTALVAGYVTAEKTSSAASPAVVTITSDFPGLAGNQTVIATSDSTIVVSAARLTGGAVDPTAKNYTF